MGLLWAKMKLTAPSMLGGRFKLRPLACASAALKATIEYAEPNLCSYERLAALYHEYARGFCPDYVGFLKSLARKYRVDIGSVLDLACGAGTLTTRLATWAPRVVGLDRSDAMLQAARELCQARSGVRFVEGDYREFDLKERFDAITCASDSLNYLHAPTELAQVFCCVARHLNPGGVFVFDALDDRGFRRSSGRFVPIQIDGTECFIVLRYDSESRVENALAVFGTEVELHRRVPIEPDDVLHAVKDSGLTVLDWFSIAGFGLLKYGGVRNFYVLQKPAMVAEDATVK
jgi:SAM-dependent methyltransferase